MNIRSGLPKGYWYNVRKYFAQNRFYTITMENGNFYDVRVRQGGYVQVSIKSMLAFGSEGTVRLDRNSWNDGNDTITRYICRDGIIEVDFLTYI